MLARWIASGAIAADAVDVVNRARPRACPATCARRATLPDGPPPDMVMLAMKPQQIDEFAAAHARGDRRASAAGVDPGRASKRRRSRRASRPARSCARCPICRSRSARAWSRCTPAPRRDAARDAVAALMAPLGLVEWVDDDAMFDAVTRARRDAARRSCIASSMRWRTAGEALGVARRSGRSGSRWRRSRAARLRGRGRCVARHAGRPRRQPGRLDARKGSTCSIATMR